MDKEQLQDPDGLCFSPDCKTLHVISTGKRAGDTGSGGTRSVYAFDVTGNQTASMRLLTDMKVDGVQCGPDGMRADILGNLWIRSSAPLAYAGVLVFTPDGKLPGRIRFHEVCATMAFGGAKRDRLFMTASKSLFLLQVGIQGCRAR